MSTRLIKLVQKIIVAHETGLKKGAKPVILVGLLKEIISYGKEN
jgi:hypothetical protein